MGEKTESKLQHILKVSWESEQMPGWQDSLSVILETTKKEFQKKNKDTLSKNTIIKPLEQEMQELQEEISM